MDERDRKRFYNEERDRFWSRDETPYREYQRDRDHRDWDVREHDYQRAQSRNRGYRDFGERGGYPGPFGWYNDPQVELDLEGRRGFEGGRSYNEQRYRTPAQYDYAQRYYQGQGDYRGYQGDYREYQGDYRGYAGEDRGREREHESFGHQLREGAQNLVRKVKRAFRGPKGYKRSDERIREDVNDRLSTQEHFDPSEIEVSVSNGEVTLVGSVRFRHEKFLAEEIADDVSGVSEVHNQLRVQREQTTPGIGGTTETTQSLGAQAATEAARNRNARAQ